MSLIQLNPVVLFNISDIISRSKDSTVGVLLGRCENEHLIVSSSFEIVQKNSVVDFEYLYKRFNQFKTIFPQSKVLGIYHILTGNEGLTGNSFTISILQQFEQFISGYEIDYEGPLFYTIFNSSNLKNYQHKSSQLFKSYTFENSKLLRTIISTTDTESIATSTIQKNKKYFTNAKDKEENVPKNVSVAKHTAELTTSLNQLQERVEKIIQYLEQDNSIPETTEARQDKIHIDNLIVQLSNKLSSFKQTVSKNNSDITILTKLQVSNLAFITEQLTILEKQKAVTKKIIMNNEMAQHGGRY